MSPYEVIRLATPSDAGAIIQLLAHNPYIHSHLDWRNPLNWLGSDLFFVSECDGNISAVLACPIDPPGFAWLRLFAFKPDVDPILVWQPLLNATITSLQQGEPICMLSTSEWFIPLLQQSGFQKLHDVIELELICTDPVPFYSSPKAIIRPMEFDDLPLVAEVDSQSFEGLWVFSLEALTEAFYQCTYRDVAVINGHICGYQMSTAGSLSTHLARLAVHPDVQHQGIAHELVLSMISRATNNECGRITVNTQSNNHASLRVYHHLGFVESGERYPVYILTK